jgi:hypothetical protein
MSIENSFLKSLNLRFHKGQSAPLLLSYNKNLKIGPQSLAHLSAEDYVKYSYISEELYDSYFTFTFVRNPWGRMVSVYKHFNYHRIMSFEDFLKVEFPKLREHRYYFIKPQVEYIFNKDDKQLVNFIGRFENFQSDFEYIKDKLAHEVSNLEVVNASVKSYSVYNRWNLKYLYKTLKAKPYLTHTLKLHNDIGGSYQTMYTAEAKAIVDEFYKADIEKFDYTF